MWLEVTSTNKDAAVIADHFLQCARPADERFVKLITVNSLSLSNFRLEKL